MNVTIIVSPKRTRDKRAAPNIYDARLSGEDEMLCSSSTVFLDAARCLLKSRRAMATDTLTMKHEGSETEALRAPVGIAARRSIEERDTGPHTVRFVAWKPMVPPEQLQRNRKNRLNSMSGLASALARTQKQDCAIS
jgi:hypothetical protein